MSGVRYASAETVNKLDAFSPVCIFNEGYQTILLVTRLIGITIGPQAKAFAWAVRSDGRLMRPTRPSLSIEEL